MKHYLFRILFYCFFMKHVGTFIILFRLVAVISRQINFVLILLLIYIICVLDMNNRNSGVTMA